MIYEYKRKVNYYETDQMGIVHHSNYIRWFEEARVELMDTKGLPYQYMEKQGIMIPVLEVNCKYKHPCKFGEQLVIQTEITKYNGIIMEVSYKVCGLEHEDLRVIGTSSHCFVDMDFKPVSLKKMQPLMHNKIMNIN